MEFFSAQESLTALQWTLRAIVAFLFLLVLTKIMGERSIAQLRLLDFVMALLLGNIISHPLSDEKLGLKGSMISMATLVTLYIAFVFISLKWRKLRKWLEPHPFPLIRNGKIFYKNLSKARISLDFLLSELRKRKIDTIEKVALALWEPDGTISFILKAEYQTLTPQNIQLVTTPFTFPKPVIKEGKIDYQELKQAKKNEAWLRNIIKNNHKMNIEDVLLATVDTKDTVKIYLYE